MGIATTILLLASIILQTKQFFVQQKDYLIVKVIYNALTWEFIIFYAL